RVELRGEEAPALDGGGEGHTVLTPGGLETLCSRLRVIGVDEVEMGAVGDPFEEPQPSTVLDAIPAHERDLASVWKSPHRPGHHVEPTALAELLAAREEQLIAQADAEERPAAVERAPKRRREPQSVESVHRVVKRAVAGKHHGVGGIDHR